MPDNTTSSQPAEDETPPIHGAYQQTFPHETSFQEAFRLTGIIWGGFVIMGMGLGILLTSLHLPWWLAPVISFCVFAGSVEFLLVGMIASHAPLLSIATNTFLVNARHLIYGLSFPLHQVKGKLAKTYSIYALTDEIFALTAGKDATKLRSSSILWMQAMLHVCWTAGSAMGAVIGASFLSHIKGVDFVMTALFIILAIDSYRATHDRVCAVLALFSALVAIVFFPTSMLTAALLLYVLLLILRYFALEFAEKKAHHHA
ncbi:AzlC family ABC transporter permease [Rothia sp. CCM 9419]|uniref:AzlC family ABC transporter permease n=1 Tax=Rothia sp. CCM 9419 TaxID=3402662 RepID=UPI003AE226BE